MLFHAYVQGVELRYLNPIWLYLNFFLFSDVFTDLTLDNSSKQNLNVDNYACHDGMNKAAQIIFDEITTHPSILNEALKAAKVNFDRLLSEFVK